MQSNHSILLKIPINALVTSLCSVTCFLNVLTSHNISFSVATSVNNASEKSEGCARICVHYDVSRSLVCA